MSDAQQRVFRLKRVRIDTLSERIVYLHEDTVRTGHLGFQPLDRIHVVAVRQGEALTPRVTGVINFCRDGLVGMDEVGLSEVAFADFGMPENSPVRAEIAPSPGSVDRVRSKLHGRRLRYRDFEEILDDVVRHRYSKVELAMFVLACALNNLELEELVDFTQAMINVGERLRFEGPLGSFFLREDSDKPIIFVAGSTGFAPVKSMVEHAFARGMRRRMILYWGTRRPEDMYLAALPAQWEREHDTFRFVPVISEPRPEDDWTGRIGLVHEAILADFPSLAGHQVYACGSTAMVEAAHPAFRERGLVQDDCFADAFRPAPQLARLGGHA